MRLKSIKLSGFKSFVDPTNIKFLSNMCAVVGPNGCGKSNVIDAVRWVMGESSAKYLRGESMTDVIFKGSKQRKPATQTSVELLFDNNEGKLIGEYTAYSEISIKRTLTTDAKNSYFLNNTKCRRKDIMDIFLGTGLGPRSYSIISQGMISGLIESKPDELRAFIEEAAGISKYKERRRETSNRMRRTTENIERLGDLREELERQLKSLHNQAKTAEKYKQLKEQQRLTKAQQQALKWRHLNLDAQNQQLTISELETHIEEINSKSTNLESSMESQRALQLQLSEQYQQQQDNFYQINSTIVALEQKIAHQDSRLRELSVDLDSTSNAWEKAKEQLSEDKTQLICLQQQEQKLLPDYEANQQLANNAKITLNKIEQQAQRIQTKWDKFYQQASPQQLAELEQSKIEHAEQISARLDQRKKKLKQDLSNINQHTETQELLQLEQQLTEVELYLDNLTDELTDTKDTLRQHRNEIDSITEQIAAERTTLNKKQGELASLEALQKSYVTSNKQVSSWVDNNKLNKLPRLIEAIAVESGWELAVEAVLNNDLQAICIDDYTKLTTAIDELKQGSITIVSNSQDNSTINNTLNLPLLLTKFTKGATLVQELIDGIYSADNLITALAVKNKLTAKEAIVTKEGVIVAKNWLKVRKSAVKNQSMLISKQQLDTLEEQIQIQEDLIADKLQQQDYMQQQFINQENLYEQLQTSRNEQQQKKIKITTTIESLTAKLQHNKEHHQQLQHDISEITEQLNQEQETIKTARTKLQDELENMAENQKTETTLQLEKDQLQQQLTTAKNNYDTVKEQAHKHELELQLVQSNITALNNAINRLSKQTTELRIKREQIQQAFLQKEDPDNQLQPQLEQLLEDKLIKEQQMQEVKYKLETTEQQIHEFENSNQQARQTFEKLRSQLEQLRIQHHELAIRANAIEEQLKEDKFDLATVLSNIPGDANITQWEQLLQQLEEQLAKLGLVNLAAIDEYKIQEKRKQHLDAQHDDLTSALEVLESVIKRIDKETKQRFKVTFDKINSGLGYLFPKVFAGGRAYLELTDDDLLSTGVTIMAQPPGKKNSTIHLLSGGEKALTAIALVFAIFQLNPSPFCMLDEVDAPLDDSNVGRYARMVTEMSSQVQFIYITHNKIAMQAANELIGVTMYEPGVSRPVAVNVEQAAVMVES